MADRASLASRLEQAPYNAALGIRVEALESEQVRLCVPYQDANSNPGRALHGGVAASVINIGGSAAALAGIADGDDLEAGTLDLGVSYLAAAIGEDIVATARVLRRGKEITYSDVEVSNESGKRIAKGTVVYRAVGRSSKSAERRRSAPWPAVSTPTGEMLRGARGFMMVPFIARLGMTVEHAGDGTALVQLPGKVENTDASGAVHEGALAALIDTTGALASWSLVGLNLSYKASTVAIHVNYHAMLPCEEAIARARTLQRNDEIFLNHVVVTSARSGHLVATGSVTYRIVVP
jgi:uncharacterized protein (TIGR00369 family)